MGDLPTQRTTPTHTNGNMFSRPRAIELKHNKCSTDQYGLGKCTPCAGPGDNISMQTASAGAPDYFKENTMAKKPNGCRRADEKITALDPKSDRNLGKTTLLTYDAAPTLKAMSGDAPDWFGRTEAKGTSYGGKSATSLTKSPNEGNAQKINNPKPPLQIISPDAPGWMQDVDRKSPKAAKKIGAQHAVIHSTQAPIHEGRSKKNGT